MERFALANSAALIGTDLQVLSGDEKEAVRALVRRLAVLGGFLAGREAIGGRPR